VRRAALVVVALSIPGSITAEPCPPRAELDGDPAAVARVRDELGKLGVALGAAGPGCRTVHARVQLDEAGALAVAVVDGAHRSEGRVVSDAALAAAWIDSWLRDDDLGGNQALVARAAVHEAPAVPASRPRVTEPSGPASGPERSVFDRGALAVGYEQWFTGDTASWSAISGGGCAAVGPVCAGARVRYGEMSIGGDPKLAPTDDRTELAVLATASTGFAFGKMAIVPELGIGVGRFHANHNGFCKPDGSNGGCDPTTDPNCSATCIDPAGNVSTVARSVDSYEPRAAAALRIEVPLFEHVWLDAIASLTYIPFAHASPFLPDPKNVPANTDPSAYAVPGEPTTSVQLGIGLRVGVP